MTKIRTPARAPKKSGIERGSGVALWRQIADRIRVHIEEGLADETGRLPTEMQMSVRFGVNRHTVRAAIAALVREGVLVAEQGRGTFVKRRRRLVYPISARTRFSQGLEGQAGERRTTLLASAQEPATAEIAQALTLSAGANVLRLETLGSADGMPVSRATSWFDAVRFSALPAQFAETGSMTRALAACGVADYTRQATRIEARHADTSDTQELQLSPGAIVLVTIATNVDAQGMPIQYSRTRFAADRVELSIGAQ